MNRLLVRLKTNGAKIGRNAVKVLKNSDGDQITGWLIVILLVVVVGAFFLTNYQGAIVEIWDGIVARIKTAFGL